MTTAVEIESDLALRPEVTTLGRPLQVHGEAPAYVGAFLLFLAGFLFLAPAGLFLFLYWQASAETKAKDVALAHTILYVGGGLALLGSCMWLGAWSKSRLGRRGSRWAYLLYPQALVLAGKKSTSVIRWDEITALLSPRSVGNFRITTRDGRTFPIRRTVRDYAGLISCVHQRVTEQIVTPAKRALDCGATVTFGPFALSREAIRYKGKTLPWDQVAALDVQMGRAGRRLRIRAAGSLLPWCYADIDSFPNGVLLPDVLRHVCPARFLR